MRTTTAPNGISSERNHSNMAHHQAPRDEECLAERIVGPLLLVSVLMLSVIILIVETSTSGAFNSHKAAAYASLKPDVLPLGH